MFCNFLPATEEHLPYMVFVVVLTTKGNVVQIKQVWIGWNRIKAATCFSENSFFEKLHQQQQIPSSSYQRTQPLVNFPNNACLRSDFSSETLSKLNNSSLNRERCTTTIKKHSLLMILQSLQFILFLRSEDDLISNCCPNVKKTVSFDDVVQFIDEEIMLTDVDFDCGITFFPETPTKIRQINQEGNYISRSCEKTQCIPSNEQHNCSIDEQHSSNIFLNPYSL